jgi:intermediate peptidase
MVHRPATYRYTHLPVVLDGLFQLTQRLFGITLQVRPATQQEAWAPHVMRVDAYQQGTSDLMGSVYLDLCSRRGKYPSAVTFPIRCGRELPGGQYQVGREGRAQGLCSVAPPGLQLLCTWLRTQMTFLGHCLQQLLTTFCNTRV